MTPRALLLLLTVPAALSGCAAHSPPVSLIGPAPDLAALAGHWSGAYASSATGRRGSIEFTVSAHGDSASGAVVMIPAGFGRPLEPWRDPSMARSRSYATPSVLTISLVKVQGGEVSGTLAPYADPETGERLHTTFVGRQVADTIAGSFTTTDGGAKGETGRWRVTRTRP